MSLVCIFIHVRPLVVSPAHCLRIMTGKCQILWKLRVVLVIIERIVFDINHIWRLYIYSIDIHTCVVVSEWRYSFKRQMIWYLYLLFFIVVRCVLCRCLLPSRLVFRCPLLLSRYLDIRDNGVLTAMFCSIVYTDSRLQSGMWLHLYLFIGTFPSCYYPDHVMSSIILFSPKRIIMRLSVRECDSVRLISTNKADCVSWTYQSSFSAAILCCISSLRSTLVH